MPRAPPQWPSSYLSFASVPVVKVTSRCQGQSNLGNAASNLEESQTDSDSLFESLWRVKSDLSKVPDVDPCRHRHSQLNQWLHDYFEHYECIIFDEFIHGDVRSWASSAAIVPWFSDGSHWLRLIFPLHQKISLKFSHFLIIIYRNFSFNFHSVGSFFSQGICGGLNSGIIGIVINRWAKSMGS